MSLRCPVPKVKVCFVIAQPSCFLSLAVSSCPRPKASGNRSVNPRPRPDARGQVGEREGSSCVARRLGSLRLRAARRGRGWTQKWLLPYSTVGSWPPRPVEATLPGRRCGPPPRFWEVLDCLTTTDSRYSSNNKGISPYTNT